MSASINVLLVEDNPGDIRLIREVLAGAGNGQFTIEHTDRLATGLTRLAGGGVDVLLLDLGLPDSVGFGTFAKAYAQAEHVPIIVLTDLPDEALAVRAVQEGAQDYLGKGEIDGRLLTRSIRYAIERKREQRQVRVQAAALSAAADAVMITDGFGRVEWVNQAFSDLTGYTAAEAAGRNPRELVNSDQHDQAFFKNLWETIRSGQTWHGEIVNRRKDGSLYTEEQSITPLREVNGQISHFVAIKQDVTERKRAEEALRKGEEKLRQSEILYRSLVEHLPQRIFVKDVNSNYVSCNAVYARDLGIEPTQIVGRDDFAFFSKELAEGYRADDRRVMSDGKIKTLDERYTVAGKDQWIHTVKVPYRDEQGAIIGVLGLFEDISERKEAEVALQQLAAIVEAADDAIISETLDGTVLTWNPAAERLLGYRADEIVGRSIATVIPEDRQVEGQGLLKGIVRGERIAHYESVRVRKDGSTCDVFLTVSPVRDQRGAIVGASTIVRDITERKRAEEIVRQASGRVARNRRTQAGIDLAIVAIATASIFMLAGSFRWLEGIAQWVLAHDIQQLPAMMLSAVFITFGLLVFGFRRWRESESELTSRRQTQATVGLLHDELDRRVKQRTVELGNANQALHTEIAGRRRTGEALRTAEERMRFALQGANVGIWDMDYVTGKLQWSEALEAHYGLKPGTFGGTFEAFVECIHPDDRQLVIDTIDAAMKSGTDFSILNRSICADGPVRWLSGIGRVHLGADGAPLRATGISIDVTERRLLEEQFQQAQKMEAVGQLASGVAHDFNNLLTVILGFSNFVIEGLGAGDPRRRDLQQVIKAGEQATTLTRQLLAFSRKQILQPVVMDLNVLVDGARHMLGRLIGEQIELVTVLAPDLRAVRVDPGQLEQIVMNLVVNARDAMPGGGRISIETANAELDESYVLQHRVVRPGSYVMLAVSDSGTGMSEEIKRRLFEPFFTTKEPGKGTGLGLATVYGIVKQSDGYIWVYSEPGAGTSFKIYLPVADREHERPLSAAAVDAEAHGTETVLVVEDEEAVRFLTKVILEKAGYRVIDAPNPKEAEALFKANPAQFDILVTDVIMPGSTGRRLFERLVPFRPDLRVLYVSGYTDDTIVHQGQLLPGVEFLQKPFTAAQLNRRVREVIDR